MLPTKLIVVLLMLCMSSQVLALSDVPFNQQLRDLISTNFEDEAGFISDDKIRIYEEGIEKRRQQVETAIRNYREKYKDQDEEKIAEKLADEGILQSYNLILDYTNRLKLEKDATNANLLAQRILELDYSTKVEGLETKLLDQIGYVKSNLKKWYIHKTKVSEGEATNLVDPKTGKFFTVEELEEMKKAGADLSLLNPPDFDTFWTNYQIEQLDVEDVYTGGNSTLFRGVDLSFPDHKDCDFKKVRKTQSKPKIDIKCKINGEKVTFKIKFGSEMHSEITSASLVATLGFNFDPSKYYRDFKMVLPKGLTYTEFVEDYESYFDGTKYPIESYIKEKGKTKKGKHYVVFTEVLVEKKPEELFRVGPWAWGETGHRGNRAARAFLLFNMWVANLDLKEAENNKLTLKPQPNGEWSFHHYQHDMGFAFGKRFREKPNAYEWNLVSSVTDTAIHMNFSNFQPNSGFDHVTYSDAKWAVRLIARLSRKQITDSVKLGGWPKEIELLLIEKLIARRNQLVKAFEVEDDHGIIEYDRHISTSNGILNQGVLTKTVFDGYTQDFGRELYYLLMPLYEGLEKAAVSATQKAIGAFDKIEVSGTDLGLDADYFGEIEVITKRKVKTNPNPTGTGDNYLVEDKMEIRIGLGAGVLFKGTGYYIKEYTLIHPAKTRREGTYKNNFIVNFLLPYHVRKDHLPKKYVLVVSDAVEAEGSAEFSPFSSLAGMKLSGALGKLSRNVIANKDGEYHVYRDFDRYNRFAAKIYADLFILRLPLVNIRRFDGGLHRKVYKVDYKKKNKDQAMAALDDYIINGDISRVANMARIEEVDTNYVLRKSNISLLGFVAFRSKRRVDDIVHVIYDEDQNAQTVEKFQLKRNKRSEWFFFGDGEEKEKNITLVGEKGEGGNLIDPMIHLQVDIEDYYTKNIELDDSYIGIVNILANNPDFIDFDPEIHTKNNVWGNTNLLIDIIYDQIAMDKLINASEETYWKAFKEITGWNDEQIAIIKVRPNRNSVASRHRRDKYRKHRYLLGRFKAVMKGIRGASAHDKSQDRYAQVTDNIFRAIYKSSGSYRPEVIATLNKIIGDKNRFLSALIAQNEKAENKYPARTPLYNEQGEEMDFFSNYYEFDFDNPRHVWDMFSHQ